ncbi:MAG: DUF4831 family protein [Bacteroidales bacterium]
MKKWILSLVSLAGICVFAQETVKITAGKHNDFGLAYSLPNTMIDVQVNVTRVSVKAGPYYQYAERYLGVQEIITEDMQYWVMNDIEMKPVAVANPEEAYLVKFKSGNPPSMYLSTEGTLLSINMPPVTMDTPAAKITPAQKGSSTPTYSVLTEEQLAAGSTAKMAEMAAKQIYRLRESRLNLVTGDVDQLPADGESFKLIMKQLDDQEAVLTAMFLGTTQKENIIKTIRVNPATKSGKEILFRFSKYLGVVDNDNLAGVPVYLNVNITEDLRPDNSPEAQKKKKDKNKGVAYIVPGKAELTLSAENKTWKSQEFSIAQLGEVMQFPTDMFDDKKAPAKAVFVPETGAVSQIVQ